MAYLDFFLPIQEYNKYTTEKPWVNDDFRKLIKERQKAYISGNKSKFTRYRNQIIRLARKLRAEFYEKKSRTTP